MSLFSETTNQDMVVGGELSKLTLSILGELSELSEEELGGVVGGSGVDVSVDAKIPTLDEVSVGASV